MQVAIILVYFSLVRDIRGGLRLSLFYSLVSLHKSYLIITCGEGRGVGPGIHNSSSVRVIGDIFPFVI